MRSLKLHYLLPMLLISGMIISAPCYSYIISKFEIIGEYYGDLASNNLTLTNGEIINSTGLFQHGGYFQVVVGHSIFLPWESFPITVFDEFPSQGIELPFVNFMIGKCPECGPRSYLSLRLTGAGPVEHYTNPHPAISDFIRQSGSGIMDRIYVPSSFVPLPVSWELFAFETFGGESNKFLLSVRHPSVPEPTSISLVLTGLVGLGVLHRKKI